jgi:hypothetical protein
MARGRPDSTALLGEIATIDGQGVLTSLDDQLSSMFRQLPQARLVVALPMSDGGEVHAPTSVGMSNEAKLAFTSMNTRSLN